MSWSDADKQRAMKLWISGQSGGQIADLIGVSRSAIIGLVHRAGVSALKATGKNPYSRPTTSRMTPKARIKAAKPPKIAKPVQIKRVIDFTKITPGDPLPPLIKLDERLWVSLPNTTPKGLLDLNNCDCRWPLSTAVQNVEDIAASPLFCAARKADNSSYCPTHSRWSKSKKPLAPLNFGKAA